MSKYLEKSTINYSNFSNQGTKSYAPIISEELKSFIFSNISTNYQILYDKITPDIKLTFTDSDNNSVTHKLLMVDDKLINELAKIELLKFFISRGAPINTYNKDKKTPLHIAIINGHFKIVKMLITYGANINAPTTNNMLPIHLALKGKIEACEELVIPKEFFKDDKKDKNELAIAVIKRIKECFDPRWLDIIKAFFVRCDLNIDVTERITTIQNNIESNAEEVNSNVLKEINNLIDTYKTELRNIYDDNDRIDKECIINDNSEIYLMMNDYNVILEPFIQEAIDKHAAEAAAAAAAAAGAGAAGAAGAAAAAAAAVVAQAQLESGEADRRLGEIITKIYTRIAEAAGIPPGQILIQAIGAARAVAVAGAVAGVVARAVSAAAAAAAAAGAAGAARIAAIPTIFNLKTNDLIEIINDQNISTIINGDMRQVKRDDRSIIQNINTLRTLIIKDLYNKIFLQYLPTALIPPAVQINNPNFNNDLDPLFIKYNTSGLDLKTFKQDTIISYANRMIVNLIDYYKTYYAYEILRNTALGNIKKIDDHLVGQFNMDILKLKTLDMRKDPANEIFMNEIDKKNLYNYNYNYNSTNEAYQCYRNNIDIIKELLIKSRYLSRDGDGNTILHYLVQLENYNLFNKLCAEKFDRLYNIKNKLKLTPIQIISNRIQFNKNNFYGNDIIHQCKPLFAEIYDSNLMIILKNNTELLNIIPKNVNVLFENLFTIYNLENVNTDIFNGKPPTYFELFCFDEEKIIWEHSEITNNCEISEILYRCILQKYSEDKNISTNPFYERFCNALVHTITLHFSSVFYDMIHKLLIDINKETLGFNDQMLNEFCRKIFEFDPTYKEQNLAQNIILNLYTYKYNENDSIPQNSNMSSLTFILEEKLHYIRGLIPGEPNAHHGQYITQRDKIIVYCNQYFDAFKDKIQLFLVNYVKFQELQYNLQKIKEQITR